MIEEFLFVLVLYEKELSNSESFCSIKRQLGKFNEKSCFYVYDNSRLPHFTEKYDNLNIEYIHDSTNSGLSVAYNLAAKYATKLNKKWMILLDQDTDFENNFIDCLIDSVRHNLNIKLFAPILKINNDQLFSPCLFKFNRGFLINKINPGIQSLAKFSPVNSGMVVNLELFNQVGGYNEKIKLDFSDFQFIEKIKKVNSDFYVMPSINFQDFSNNEKDIYKLNKRFYYFCDGAKKFERNNLIDSILFFVVVFQRMISLIVKTRSLIYVRTFIENYIIDRK